MTLNLPDEAVGRKLKCPKCAVKFLVAAATAPARRGSSSESSFPGSSELSAESTIELTKRQSSTDLPVRAGANGDPIKTFDLPLMNESKPKANGSSGKGGRQVSDALALFDDRPVAPRRKTAAEARAQSRRCPTCGGVVPPGMSLCQTCGLDLETGSRVSLVDDLTPTPTYRQQGIPGPVAVVGFLCLGVSVLCTLLALLKWLGGASGAMYFIPVAGFGVYASISYLRHRSPRLLLVALSLGALIDLAGFVALPLYNAINEDAPIVPIVQAEKTGASASEIPAESAEEAIRPVSERLDTNQLTLGICLLVAYGVISIYTLSLDVQRHQRR
jgi:hypothetical protein